MSQEALEHLFREAGGPFWLRKDSWNDKAADLSKWYGVTVKQGRVVKLDLPNNNLIGKISASVRKLDGLQVLHLFCNKLSGPIPKEIGDLSNLVELWLNNNLLQGRIPEEVGNLVMLEELRLHSNKLSGPIPKTLGALHNLHEFLLRDNNKVVGPPPKELMDLPNYGDFDTGLAHDGPSLPPVKNSVQAVKIMVVQLVLGYLDLFTDLSTAISYYIDGHVKWFVLGLIFALGPGFIFSQYFLTNIGWMDRLLVACSLSSLVEARRTVQALSYSPTLALLKVIEPLFESVPQLLLQLYVMLWRWGRTQLDENWDSNTLSVCVSATNLAYVATRLSSVESLLHRTGGDNDTRNRFRICPHFPSLTSMCFSRVPEEGASTLGGFGNVHPRTHVWLCFMYHTLEVFCRFVPLAMIALVIRGWFLLVLPYLWISRGLIVWTAARISADLEELKAARKALNFRFRVRLVGMPFLDSLLDGAVAFGFGLVVTLVESIAFIAIYHVCRDDELPSSVRQTLTIVAIGGMVGKMCLAWVAIFPLKKYGFGAENPIHVIPVETGGGATNEPVIECEVAP